MMHIFRRGKSLSILSLILACASPSGSGGGPQEALSVGIIPNENLVIEGIPIIPHQIEQETRLYTEFRPSMLRDVHPQSNKILIANRPVGGQTTQLHQVESPLATKQQLTSYEDRVGDASYEPKNGAYFVFSKDVDGGEWHQNYRYDLADGKVTLLTDGTSKNTLGVWSNRGDFMAYASNRRNKKDYDFYIINPLQPSSDRKLIELSHGEGWAVLDWSPDDKHILGVEYISATESYLWSIDVKSGKKKALTPRNGKQKVSYYSAKFSRDGKNLFVITDKDSEFLRLAKLELATGRYTYFTSDISWDIEDFEISHKGNQIAYTSNEDGISKLYLLQLDAHLRQTDRMVASAIPIGVIGHPLWSAGDEKIFFDLSHAHSPTDVYACDFQSRTLTKWTESPVEGPQGLVKTEGFATAKLVSWDSFDKRKISGFLYEPSAVAFPGKRPVMVVIHGGPESQFRPTFLGRYNYFVDQLGVALLFPNIRGSTGYGKTFTKLADGRNRVDAYEDLNTMLDWIKTQNKLDGDRILVSGGSYGGHATLAVATRYNEKIACSIDIVGMSNLVTFLKNTEPYRQDLRRVVYGDERDPAMREFLESIAPLNHVQNITKPLFVIQGFKDPRVPYTEARQMVDAVKGKGVPVWFLMAKDEGHGFAKKSNADYQFYATIEFVRKYLLPSQQGQ